MRRPAHPLSAPPFLELLRRLSAAHPLRPLSAPPFLELLRRLSAVPPPKFVVHPMTAPQRLPRPLAAEIPTSRLELFAFSHSFQQRFSSSVSEQDCKRGSSLL